jgi:ketosteroid isomerase-like protein
LLAALALLAASAPARADERAGARPAENRPGTAARGPVRGMDFDVFIRLERGMTEGELLVRAGPPDHVAVEGFRDDVVKTFYYLPTVANPFTTVVTLRGGRIVQLERIRKF